jgi:L-fuculose-phosphate aldolase
MKTPQELIVEAGKMMFERRLTDISGGNISLRDGGTIYITPRYSGQRRHWALSPEDILAGPLEGDELISHPMCSRESKVHLAIYRAFPEAEAVFHAHPHNVQPFVAAGIPIPPLLEGNQKLGVIEVVPYTPAHSSELAEKVVEGFKGQGERIRVMAAALLLAKHGVVVAARDIYAGLDALERIDTNCWCILMEKIIQRVP